jgi:hypothetical protein
MTSKSSNTSVFSSCDDVPHLNYKCLGEIVRTSYNFNWSDYLIDIIHKIAVDWIINEKAIAIMLFFNNNDCDLHAYLPLVHEYNYQRRYNVVDIPNLDKETKIMGIKPFLLNDTHLSQENIRKIINNMHINHLWTGDKIFIIFDNDIMQVPTDSEISLTSGLTGCCKKLMSAIKKSNRNTQSLLGETIEPLQKDMITVPTVAIPIPDSLINQTREHINLTRKGKNHIMPDFHVFSYFDSYSNLLELINKEIKNRVQNLINFSVDKYYLIIDFNYSSDSVNLNMVSITFDEKCIEEPHIENESNFSVIGFTKKLLTILGHSTTVILMLDKGILKMLGKFEIFRVNHSIKTVILGIEMFNKLLEEVHVGDNASTLLRCVDKKEVIRGQTLTKLVLIIFYSMLKEQACLLLKRKRGVRKGDSCQFLREARFWIYKPKFKGCY